MTDSLSLAMRRPMVLAVVGSLIIAWAGIFVKLADTSVATSATLRCALAVPILLVLVLIGRDRNSRSAGFRISRPIMLVGLFAGIGSAGRLVYWHKSIDLIGAGMGTVLQDAQAVMVPFAAWIVLRERPTSRHVLSLPVVMVGGVMIAGVIGVGEYGSDPALGAVYGLLAAASYTVFQLAIRNAVTDGISARTALLAATIISTVITVTWGVATGTLVTPGLESLSWLVALAVIVQVLGWLMIVKAMVDLSAASISLVLLLQPVGAVILGGLIFGESPSGIQWIGIGLIIIGIAIAASSALSNRD